MDPRTRATRLSLPLLVALCFWVAGGESALVNVLSGVHDPEVLSCGSASRLGPGIGSWLAGVSGPSVPCARAGVAKKAPAGGSPAAGRFLRGHGGYLLPLARSPDSW